MLTTQDLDLLLTNADLAVELVEAHFTANMALRSLHEAGFGPIALTHNDAILHHLGKMKESSSIEDPREWANHANNLQRTLATVMKDAGALLP